MRDFTVFICIYPYLIYALRASSPHYLFFWGFHESSFDLAPAWARLNSGNDYAGLNSGKRKRTPVSFMVFHCVSQAIPSGELWKITIFNGKIHYKWWFSIAMLVHQRVSLVLDDNHTVWWNSWGLDGFGSFNLWVGPDISKVRDEGNSGKAEATVSNDGWWFHRHLCFGDLV